VEGTVREVKRRVRVVASSYRAIDRSVTRWIVVTMVEWKTMHSLARQHQDVDRAMVGGSSEGSG